MRIMSWNVAGLRACISKGFYDSVKQIDADVICLQEVKATPEQVDVDLPGYTQIWNSASRKGYSGTLILSRLPIVDKVFGTGVTEGSAAEEGRVITVDLGDRYLTTAYVPNSKKLLARLQERLVWEDDMLNFLMILQKYKPVIYCGDLNVAHEPIDLRHPDKNHETPGFSDEERKAFGRLLGHGFVDTFRALHPGQEGKYTFWTYFGNARENNAGWRLDYFLVSETLFPNVRTSQILSKVYGSDHCPIVLDID